MITWQNHRRKQYRWAGVLGSRSPDNVWEVTFKWTVKKDNGRDVPWALQQRVRSTLPPPKACQVLAVHLIKGQRIRKQEPLTDCIFHPDDPFGHAMTDETPERRSNRESPKKTGPDTILDQGQEKRNKPTASNNTHDPPAHVRRIHGRVE